MKVIEFEVGILLVSKVRDFISRLKFEGHNIEVWESSGWLSREFVIKGDERTIQIAYKALSDWKCQLETKRA